MQDFLDISISIGTIYNLLKATAIHSVQINTAQDLSMINVGLHDELFQGNQPVLTGIDAKFQGLNSDYTIADAASGLCAGQRAAFGDFPCHGDVFHIQHQCETLANLLERLDKGSISRRQHLEKCMGQAVLKGQGNT